MANLKKTNLKKKIAKKPVKTVKKPKKPTQKTLKKKKVATASFPKVKKETSVIIGKITHYFPHVKAGVVKLKHPLTVGDTVKIKGHTTDFTYAISSIQIDRTSIQKAKKGQEIGLLVTSRVRKGDKIYKI